LTFVGFVPAGRADSYTTTNIEPSGQSWTNLVWKLNGAGTAVAPVAGNTYTMVTNGISTIGNGLNNTRVRNPTYSNFVTFPGDVLTVNTNTELRFKTNTQNSVTQTLNFPGVGGNPGLVLNGGLLNGGDNGTYVITGLVQVVAQSYISHAANGGGGTASASRAVNFAGGLTGSGNLVIINCGTNNGFKQQVSSKSNSYSGQWIVQCGWLLGSGTNSLGTNSITADRLYTGYQTDMPLATATNIGAIFEVNYDINSAGTLTLMNGGLMRLHQNCCFTAVNIEGNALSAGTYYYADLVAAYPNNFAPGGFGALTVQPFGAPPTLSPLISTQPLPQLLYAGRTAHFTAVANANGVPGGTYQWRKNGTPLSDGGNISGSGTNTLVIANVSSADADSYDVVFTTSGGSATTVAVPLIIVEPTGEAYEAAVIAANPYAYYRFNDVNDPGTNNALAYDFAGGDNGFYGTAVQNGNPFYNIAGPTPAFGYPGFAGGNAAAQFSGLNTASRVTMVNPWNLNTNALTITAWINPSGTPSLLSGLVFCRGGGTVAGLNFSPGVDISGNTTLSYTWDNEFETYNWYSGLPVPPNQWSFVALVVTPTNATIHLMNTNGLASATHTYNHVLQSFGAGSTTLLGDDSGGTGGNRVFSGIIDEVAVFNAPLSKSQLLGLYTSASGVANYAPIIIGPQPTNLNLYVGQTARFAVSAGGSDPLTYQWQAGPSGSGTYSYLSDGGRIAGSSTAALTIAHVQNSDNLDYVATVANAFGSVTSAPANLTISSVNPLEHITLTYSGTSTPVLQPTGADWDTAADWSDGNSASVSAVQKPGSTYELAPSGGLNARLRTPTGPSTAVFPGDVLTVTGNAIWTNNPSTNGATAEVRFKQPTPGGIQGTVIFKKLVMNGGQLDAGADSGGNINSVNVGGEIDILTNAPLYNDNGADRGFLISAWLTGATNTSIEYHGYNQTTFQTNYTNCLNIAGTSNTFAGKWNIVLGTLLGSAPGALGTNDITIGANAALETTYDLNNPNGNLFLNGNGRMYLHQNDTFKSLFISGVPLAVGNYSFAQLNAAYPTTFPNFWTPQNGAASYTNGGSGSITVLVQPPPIIVQQPVSVAKYPTDTAQFTVLAQGALPLFYQWRKGGVNLTDSGNISGSGTTNLTLTNIVSGNAGNYDVVVSNFVGSVTSLVATLTVNPTGPARNLTLNFDQGAGPLPIQQPNSSDWNTVTNWSDGQSASISALSNPGSTYEVIPGARLRSPAGAANSVFPGVLLKIDGDGIWATNISTIGELRFKHANPGTNFYKKLVMNGGQLDNGDNGVIVIQGEMDILANTPVYVDQSAGQDRAYQIDAFLTGSAPIELHQFSTGFTANFNITCPTNTFSGNWNVVQGVLLGSAVNCLGPNSISLGSGAALETLYDLSSPNASLVLNGQLFLHQNDTFGNVAVNGAWLAAGTYTFAQLNAAYPANFPASWSLQSGSTFSTGSGSLTVLHSGATITAQFVPPNLQLTWSSGLLLEATNLSGPWTTNVGASSPFTILPTEPQKFYRVLVQ
jgi:hypothetical protein